MHGVPNKALQFANCESFFGKLQIEITIFLGNCESTFFDDVFIFLSELFYLLCPLL